MSGKNVEVRNGTIKGFETFVYSDSDNQRVINIRASATGQTFPTIFLRGYNSLVQDCNVVGIPGTTNGIYVVSGLVTNCVASNGGFGINVVAGSVIGNHAYNNGSNFILGNDNQNHPLLVDKNSASGGPNTANNYYVAPGSSGITWGVNAGR